MGIVKPLSLSLAVALPIAALAFAAPAQAGDYYVATNGGGTTCTSALPCDTIAKAMVPAADGDTVHIGPGTYTAPVVTTERLTFVGAGAGTATSTNLATDTFIDIPGAGQNRAMELRGGGRVSNLRLRGQTPLGSQLGADALALVPNAGPDGLTYSVDHVVAIGGGGIQHGSGIAVNGNVAPSRVFSVAISASALRSDHDGLFIGAANATVSMQDSDLHGALDGLAVSTARATRVHGDSAAVIRRGNLVIDRSRFDTSAGSALFVLGAGGTARATVRNSVFTSVDNGAFQPTQPAAAGIVQGGTLAGEDSALTSVGSTFYATGARMHAALLGQRVQNRLGNVGIHLVGTVARLPGANGVTSTDVLATTENSNVAGTVTIDASHSAFSSSRAAGLSTGPAVGSATNVTGDPRFVAAPIGTVTGANFSLQPGSPLVDRGDTASVTAGELDLAGAARSLDGNGDCSAVPDIGAYERPAAACAHLDTTKPAVSKLKVSRGKARFTLSEAARLTLFVERRAAGRRSGRRCVAHRSHGKRCTRWVRVRKLSRAGKAGSNAIKLGKLHNGHFRVRVSAVDTSGNVSVTAARTFRIRRR
jgi:hypothetical protein